MKIFFKYHFLFFFWMLILFLESSFPADFYPEVKLFNADKIVHMLVYGFLAMVCYISFIHQKKIKIFYEKPVLCAIIFSSLYGASDEIHQYFVPKRSCDFFDWAADTIGIIIMILIIKYFLQKKLSLFRKPELNYGT